MFRRPVVLAVALALLLLTTLTGAPGAGAQTGGVAPGAPGEQATWTTGAKTGVGTSTSEASKVWYTLAEGALTDVYYPTADVGNLRDLEFVVSDGTTFAERESEATTRQVRLADDEALVYEQVNTATSGRYRITKTYVTDPARATVAIDVRFTALVPGDYGLYVVADPALGNSGLGDSGTSEGGALVASDGDVASALVSSRGFTRTSNGYLGTSDGWTDLRDDFTLDATYASAPDGNLVQTGQVDVRRRGTTRFTLALGYGATTGEALNTAEATLDSGFRRVARSYTRGWSRYLRALDAPANLPADLRTQYAVAVMTLRAHEDKTYRGGNIASLTVPWGQAVNANEAGVGGYHLVWSRDLYQVATAQLAAGDVAGAERSLDYLFEVQQKPDGSFPQNSTLDGTPYFGSLQLDEVAFPLVLAYQLGRDDAGTWTEHVQPAADFLVARGPATPQERWEEEGGYSPSSLAAEIAGLVAAAELAEANGATASAALYLGVADEWQRRVEDWTVTTTGPLSPDPYYLRITADDDPDDGDTLEINNGGGAYDERAVVDAGFLELVRLGIRSPADPLIADSLAVVDAQIRRDTPNGSYWYRYTHDGYGEKADGAPYDGTGVGRLWPLLSGERGEYELAGGRAALANLRAMANAANEGYLIPEQVWDSVDPTAYGFALGEGTGSATPLAWSMAQFIRLAHGIDAGTPVETPQAVAARYAAGDLPDGPALTVTAPEAGSATDAETVTVTGTTTATEVVVNAGGATVSAPVTDGTFAVEVELGLGENQLTTVALGADGGTSVDQRTVTSTNFGTPLGGPLSDPTGDDDGPGTYVYPTNSAFNAGAFDVTGFGVYDDGANVNFVTTIAGEVLNPFGGNGISVQRLNVYVRTGTGTGTGAVPALPGVNADVADPWDYVVIGDGFDQLGVQDPSGAQVGSASILTLAATRQIVVSVPRDTFGAADLGAAQYAVAMLSHGAGDEGIGSVRPVYDLAYWSAPPPGQEYVTEYRFGGGAGVLDPTVPSRDTDTRDPNVIDLLVPPGADQATVLDYLTTSPVVLPYVELDE